MFNKKLPSIRQIILACIPVVGSALIAMFGAYCLTQATAERSQYLPMSVPGETVAQVQNISLGKIVDVKVTKCNDLDHPIDVTTSLFLEDGVKKELVNFDETRSPGCAEQNYKVLIPDDVPSGSYRVKGTDVASGPRGETQTVNYSSHPFPYEK